MTLTGHMLYNGEGCMEDIQKGCPNETQQNNAIRGRGKFWSVLKEHEV